ncbi:MAG: glycosyltransferase family 39 protein [Chloroflexota bacterium]
MQRRTLSLDESGTLILLGAILFGGWFRFMPTWLAGFPINDGGMFYTMMNDLQANRFIPPLYTTYNNLNIPFAYPPLALYIGAFISSLLNISEIEILRWLPAFFNTLTIPVFFLLAKEIIGDKFKGAVATFAFAFTPHLTTWLSAGGGLTRSLGTVFMILTVYFAWKLLVKEESKSLWGVIISGSLAILSHTESSVYALTLPMLIWLVKSRSLKTAIQAGWVAIGVLLLAGPWYGWVTSQHGIAPLLSALKTGSQTIWSVLRLINIDILTEEPYLDLLGVFGILGIIFLVAKKDYFLPLMLVTIYLVQPRSAHTIGNIPLAMSAGMFFTNEILPRIGKWPNGRTVLVMALAPYILINFIYFDTLLAGNHLSQNERMAMEWVRKTTPTNGNFLILTGEPDAMCESSAEWFPALTERKSLTTLQGSEWLINDQFGKRTDSRIKLRSCINSDAPCLHRAVSELGDSFDFIYISFNAQTYYCKPANAGSEPQNFALMLSNSNDYSLVFASEEVVVFKLAK